MSYLAISTQIQKATRIAILGHRNGDADCYGSAFALAQMLWSLGKHTDVVSGENVPENMDYLFFYFDGVVLDHIAEDVDLLFVVDSSDLERVSLPQELRDYLAQGKKLVCLDHHPIGDISEVSEASVIRSTACSTSELVFDLGETLGIELNKNMATCILAGIIGDTSGFQNQSTNQECLEIAATLMKKGARLKTIINHTFGNKDVDSLKLWGLAMERLSVNQEYGTVTTYLTHDDIVRFGLSGEAISGIVNYLNSVKGARMVVLVTEEEPGQIKVSFRTRDEKMNVSALARQIGGGGHVKASGLSFSGRLIVEGNSVTIV